MNSLGPLIDRYPVRPLSGRAAILLSILGCAGTIAPLANGIFHYYYGYTKYGPVAAQAWSRPWYLLALLSLAAFIVLVFIRLRWAFSYIALHRDGLHITYARPSLWRWANLAGIAVSAIRPQWPATSSETRYKGVLIPATGRPIQLPGSIPNLPLLLTQIKAHLYPRLAKELLSNFAAGQWLYFGEVSVQTQAIRLGNGRSGAATIPWTEIELITVQSGYLVIELKNGSPHRFPVARIPNIEILLQIVQSGVST